ncbi:MAG: type I glyceraldehyde-3-phosphate dehydrogenase [Patescibacteria group bacterium]|jgi:glyceraldehyde 3-phosphate dehydrogenase
MPARIAINGFGRIGRAAFKIALEREDVEVVAINDLTDTKTLAYLLKFDSAYGTYHREVTFDENNIIVDKKNYPVYSEKEPQKLPWKDLNVDVVMECTGRFTKDNAAKAHVDAGAKKVIVSAPTSGEGDVQTFLLGVNESQYLGQNVISNASCTTNCISPVVDIMHRNFKILKSVMTTIHAITATQNVVDGPLPGGGDDYRRARAAGYNMVPTTTGAAKATTKVIPELKGLFDGISVRVPIITGSISDITMLVEKETTAEEVNAVFKKAAEDPRYKNILAVTEDPIVSSDIIGNPHSAIVDLELTTVVDKTLVKVLAWYDNEWGYSNRMVELAVMMTS